MGASAETDSCEVRSYSMSLAARNVRISSASSIVRRASGIVTRAICLSLPPDGFEQELQNLDMPLRLRERLPPGVEAVSSDQERVEPAVGREGGVHGGGHARHLLIVLHDRDPLPMLVRADALEALEHLEPRQAEPASRGISL